MILIEWLMNVWPIAANMGYKKVAAMIKEFKYLTFEESGVDIIKEGERGLTFYIVIAGEVEVSKKGVGIVGKLNRGSTFGEIALSQHKAVKDGDLRTATITTLPGYKPFAISNTFRDCVVIRCACGSIIVT